MANPVPRADLEVANQLNAQIVSLALGTNLFHSPVKPPGTGVPIACVFCVMPFGGLGPLPYLGKNEDFLEQHVQVFVRGARDDFSGSNALAREIWSALHRATPIAAGYITILVRESQPTYIGLDNTESPRWVLNTRLLYSG